MRKMTLIFSHPYCFPIIAFCSLLLRLILVGFRKGYNHPNEIYRVIDPINSILNGYFAPAFEWDLNILSWFPVVIHTAIIAPFFKYTDWVFPILRSYYALFSLAGLYSFHFIVKKHLGLLKANLASAFVFIAFIPLAYWHIHLLDSILTGHLLLISLALFEVDQSQKSFKINFIIGALFGLSFWIRIQSLTFGLIFFVYSLIKKQYRRLFPATLGFLSLLLLGAIVDMQFGYDFLSMPFTSFKHQILEGRAAKDFGSDPIYRYFFDSLKFFSPPLFLLILLGLKQSLKRVPLVFFVTLGQFLILTLISHKEFRFMFPLLIPFFLLAILGLDEKWKTPLMKKIMLLLIFSGTLASGYRGLFKYSYETHLARCNELGELGRYFSNSTLKSKRLYIEADLTFRCGSYRLGKIDLKQVRYVKAIPRVVSGFYFLSYRVLDNSQPIYKTELNSYLYYFSGTKPRKYQPKIQ